MTWVCLGGFEYILRILIPMTHRRGRSKNYQNSLNGEIAILSGVKRVTESADSDVISASVPITSKPTNLR